MGIAVEDSRSFVDSLRYLGISFSVGTSGTGAGRVGTSSCLGDCGWILAFRDSVFVGVISFEPNRLVETVDRFLVELEEERARRLPFSLNSVDLARRGTA